MKEFIPVFKNLTLGQHFNIKPNEKPLVTTKMYARIYFYLKTIHDARPFSSNSFYWKRDIDEFIVYHESQVEME